MAAAHRETDPRSCGALTTVVNQDSVTVNQLLWSVQGDTNNHGSGALDASTDSSVTIHGIPVVVHQPTGAAPDDLCPIEGGAHCEPETAGGSSNVSAY